MSDSTPDWEELYQADDTGWDRGDISPALPIWLDMGVFEGAKNIIIPGCGRGYEVVELAKRGFHVTALDLAPSAITHLNKTLKSEGVADQVTAVCTNIFDYKDTGAFDVVYEQTCLCAIQPSERQYYADAVFNWLKPNGKLLLSMMQKGAAGGPPFHCDWINMRQLFVEGKWAWQLGAPIMIERGAQAPIFELGFVLQRLGSKA